MNKKHYSQQVLRRLEKLHNDKPATGLKEWKTPWQYLFSVILSAQANDDQVNKVTKPLFKKLPTLESFLAIDQLELEQLIKQIGFYRVKAKYLKRTTELLLTKFNGKVPRAMTVLLQFPGVGRKTASVVQGVLWGRSEGIAVDTHVARMSKRLGFTKERSQEKIEKALMRLFPKSQYHRINPALFWHGRTVCTARKPQCEKCVLNDICPSAFNT